MEKRLIYFRNPNEGATDSPPALDFGALLGGESAEQEPDNQIEEICSSVRLSIKDLLKNRLTPEDAAVLGQDVMANLPQVQENLRAALKLLKKRAGDVVKIDPKSIFLAKLPGDKVGLSVEGKTILDPVELLKPPGEIGVKILHELVHDHDTVPHEGLAEYITRGIARRTYWNYEASNSYDDWVEKFGPFIERFDKNGDGLKAAIKVQKMYKNANGKGIFKLYFNTYVKKLPRKGEARDQAMQEFNLHFPEFGRYIYSEETIFGERWRFDEEKFQGALIERADGRKVVEIGSLHDHWKKPAQPALPPEVDADTVAADAIEEGTDSGVEY